MFTVRCMLLQGFSVMLVIYLAAVFVVVINVGRSRIAGTAECIQVRLLFFCSLVSLHCPDQSYQFELVCPRLKCPALT